MLSMVGIRQNQNISHIRFPMKRLSIIGGGGPVCFGDPNESVEDDYSEESSP